MSIETVNSETDTRRPKVPEWLMILFGLLVYGGMIYAHKFGGELDARVYEPYKSWNDVQANWPESDEPEIVAEGRVIYSTICSGCHHKNGTGNVGIAPPLLESEWVLTERPGRVIRVVMNGLTGPITVKGEEYNLSMLNLGLNDAQIAAVVSYIRQSPEWGHDASLVTEEEVTAVRTAVGTRAAQWTAEELEAIPVSE